MNYAALGVRDSDTTIQVLFEISSAVSKADNLDELYKVIHKSLGRLLNVDNFFIALYHEDKDSITFPYYVDEIDKDIGEVFEVTSKQSLTANVINQGRALLATEADLMRMASQNSGELIGTPCKVWVGAPLKIKDKAFGALVLQSYTSRNVYKESDLDLLKSVSDFVAISIDRKRAEKAQQESEDINRTLFEISRAVNTTENLSELFESIYSSLNRIIDITNFYIALYEKETNKIIFPFHYDEYDNLDEWNIAYLKTDSLTNEVFQALKPVLLTKKELEIRAEQKRIVGTTPLIWLGVPLLIRGEIKGVMVTQSYSDPKLFDQRDVDILNSVSEQIAMAIERKQSEENIRQNEKLTKTLFRISNAINITDKLDDLYQSIYDSLNILISLPNFFISIVEEDKRLMHFPLYIDEYDEDNISFTVDYSETSNYIAADVIRSKKPLFLKKKALFQKHTQNQVAGTMPVIWLGVPLIVRDKVIGVMVVQHYSDPDYFKQNDMDLFVAVSDQIALAIDRKQSQEIILEHKKNLEKIVSIRTRELEQTMNELFQSEKRFRETIELLPEVIFETDINFNLTYVNQKAFDLFQYTREDFEKGIAAIDMVADKDRNRAMKNIVKILSGELLQSPEYLVCRKDGTTFPAIIDSMPLYKEKQCIGLRGLIIDISVQKKAQEERETMVATNKEMEIAKNIQTSLLPSLDKFKAWNFEITANMTPAEKVGGDYYDVIQSIDNKLWFGIGDVTGHGLVSGLIMMMAQVSINTLIRSIPGLTPEQVLICANQVIQANIREGLKVDHHMTINFIVEEVEGFYKYAGAHEIILIYRADTQKIEQIPTKGMWLGIIPDISIPTNKYAGQFYLNENDVLFLYTDGVIEVCNQNREQYDIARLEQFLKANAHKETEAIKQNLLYELNEFMEKQIDDITFLIMKKL